MAKQTLFISYCWKDGNVYADELESQLNDVFDVKRDKSQLIANDDIYDFMADIATCDNVILVLTREYVKSLNCMLEMSYLVAQSDWAMKAMVLVIDDSLYSLERKIEIINYWMLRQKRNFNELNSIDVGKTIYEQEKEYIDLICEQVELFFSGISRRKNPSQIAIVNEVIKKSKRNPKYEKDLIGIGEKAVEDVLEKYGHLTIKELTEKTCLSQAATRRYVSSLSKKGVIKQMGEGREKYYIHEDH